MISVDPAGTSRRGQDHRAIRARLRTNRRFWQPFRSVTCVSPGPGRRFIHPRALSRQLARVPSGQGRYPADIRTHWSDGLSGRITKLPKLTMQLSFASGVASGSRMGQEVQKQPPSVPGWGVGVILSPSARTGLADLALQPKVGQTVGCSTFTCEAKPATRRVADGERMNPRDESARSRQCRRRRVDSRGAATQAATPPHDVGPLHTYRRRNTRQSRGFGLPRTTSNTLEPVFNPWVQGSSPWRPTT